MDYKVVHTVFDITNGNQLVKKDRSFEPIACNSGELDFSLDKCSKKNENYIYVYHMQVKALQQDFKVDTAKESCENRPPRYLQTVTGYFPLSADYPTRLKLNYMWDKSTVKNNIVLFYALDRKTGQPTDEMPKPEPYSSEFEAAVA